MFTLSPTYRRFLALALLALAAPVARAADGIRFKVVNTTPDEIREIYVCPTGAEKWGPNLLPQRALAPGKAAVLTFPGGCGTYDIRMVAPGGTEYMEYEVRFCEPDDVMTVGDGALTKKSAREAGEKR
jgi:hypothetical protein